VAFKVFWEIPLMAFQGRCRSTHRLCVDALST
jgi:hypothetical protein